MEWEETKLTTDATLEVKVKDGWIKFIAGPTSCISSILVIRTSTIGKFSLNSGDETL